MFTLWYSILSFKEYRNSVCSGSTCTKSNDVRPISPKPSKPSTPVQIPTKTSSVQVSNPAPASPTHVIKPSQSKPTTPPRSNPMGVRTPSAPNSPNRFQQMEQQQENRTRSYQPSPLAARKPEPVAVSAQFIKREKSYSSEEEEELDEDDDEEEDSEIERIDLHHK